MCLFTIGVYKLLNSFVIKVRQSCKQDVAPRGAPGLQYARFICRRRRTYQEEINESSNGSRVGDSSVIIIAKSDPQQALHHVALDDPEMENIFCSNRRRVSCACTQKYSSFILRTILKEINNRIFFPHRIF